MENIIYQKNRIVLFSEYEDPKLHKHFSKHILVSNQPFICLVNECQYHVRSMIVQSQILHSVKKEKNAKMVVFLIDEPSSLSKRIDREYLQGKDSDQLPHQMEKNMIHLIDGGCSLDEIDAYMMEQFYFDKLDASSYDDRILYAIKYIDESENLNNEIYELLPKKTFLSKSRFLHLFKEEVGIDLRNFLLLKRMEKTYDYILKKNMSITEAAMLSGFSSSSHFSDACKKHYGISLTDFLKAQKI